MKFNYIAIEREYASGGSSIGKKVGEILGIPCYGKEIPEITAEKSNLSIEHVLELEENSSGSLLYSLSRMSNIITNGGKVKLSDFEEVVIEEMKVIKELANNGAAVFVGRTAAHALKERKNILKVFIHASMDFREQRAIKTYDICKSNVKDIIKKYDKRRGSFYKANFGKDWKHYSDYDLVLDSSILGIDKCAQVIAECAR